MASDYTRCWSLQTIKGVMENLPKSVQGDKLARRKMHDFSTMAGMAFGQAFLGINHSLAHKMAKRKGIYQLHHLFLRKLCHEKQQRHRGHTVLSVLQIHVGAGGDMKFFRYLLLGIPLPILPPKRLPRPAPTTAAGPTAPMYAPSWRAATTVPRHSASTAACRKTSRCLTTVWPPMPIS